MNYKQALNLIQEQMINDNKNERVAKTQLAIDFLLKELMNKDLRIEGLSKFYNKEIKC